MLYSEVLTACQNNNTNPQTLQGQAHATVKAHCSRNTWRLSGWGDREGKGVWVGVHPGERGPPTSPRPSFATAGYHLHDFRQSVSISFVCIDITVVFDTYFLILSISNFTLIFFSCVFWGWNLTFCLFGSIEEFNRCGLDCLIASHHTHILPL